MGGLFVKGDAWSSEDFVEPLESILGIESVQLNGYNVTTIGTVSTYINGVADGDKVLDEWDSKGEREKDESSSENMMLRYGKVE